MFEVLQNLIILKGKLQRRAPFWWQFEEGTWNLMATWHANRCPNGPFAKYCHVKFHKSGTFCSEEASAPSVEETFSSTHCAREPAKVWWVSQLWLFMSALTIHATFEAFGFSSCFLSRPKKTNSCWKLITKERTMVATRPRSTPSGMAKAKQQRTLTPEIVMHSKAARNLIQPKEMHLTINWYSVTHCFKVVLLSFFYSGNELPNETHCISISEEFHGVWKCQCHTILTSAWFDLIRLEQLAHVLQS